MSNSTDSLTQLRELLKHAQESLQQCNSAFKGYRAFQGNNGGIVFCTVQLQQAAAALRGHADALAAIATDLHTTHRDLSEQLDLHDVGMNGRP